MVRNGQTSRRRTADRAGARLRRPAPHPRRARGRAGHRREGGRAVHLPGPGHRRARRRGPRTGGAAGRRLRPSCWSATSWPGTSCGGAATSTWAATATRRSPAPSTCTSSTCSRPCRAHHRPRRRGPGPGAARRGLPGPHLLGRAVHLPVPEPALPRADPVPAPATATGGCPRPARRPGRPATRAPCTRGRAAATAARRPSGCTSTRKSGRWLPDTLPPPAPRQPRHRLQRLAVLPGHRRHRVPARPTGPR